MADIHENVLKNLGSTLKQLRTEKGITQVELGKLASKPQSTIARVESGMVPDVALRVVYEFVDAMDVSLTELFSILEKKKVPETTKTASTQNKKLDTIIRRIHAMDEDTRNWILKLFEFIIDNPPRKKQ